MRHTKRLPFILFILCYSAAMAQQVPGNGPLFIHSNAPVEFKKISAPGIKEAVAATIESTAARIKKISGLPVGRQTIANTLMALDELQYYITELQMKLGLISSTYSDDSIRNAATEENDKLSLYASDIILNEGLYKAIKQFANSGVAKLLLAPQKKYLKETLLAFEKNGMKLPPAARKELEAINKKIIELGSLFDKNIAESKDSVEFTEAELKGVPAEVVAGWKRASGNYMVYLNGPNSNKIAQYAESNSTRRTMYMHYNNRAFPKNIAVLDSLFYYRQVLAAKLGFKSYADQAMVDKMAEKTVNVWNFENDLVAKLTPHVTEEIQTLKTLKHTMHPEEIDSVYAWDIGYYNKKLLDTKYQLNTDEVKEYFEMSNTIKGMFGVYEMLFSIKIKEVAPVSVWDTKVRQFEMMKEGKKIGSFYLDLYPRLNKYTHFACYPISQYRKAGGREVLPVSALVCNFPEATATTPSLLNHSDVITLFHEFGHLVHSMLGRADIAAQGPFGVKGDFVEAPSQFLENWCWEYASLKTFAKHYKTGVALPETLFNKMKQAQLVNSGISTMRQLYLGIIDLTFEDKYAAIKDKGILQTSKDIFAINQIPFPEGSNFICSFGHLNGYGANYYGYLWSKVFAQDMFSVFQENGVMNNSLGVKYRKEILEKGSTRTEMDMLRSFLGREPNSKAFLLSIGIK